MARLAGVAAFLCTALSAPAALACNVPDIAVSTPAAAPGQPVNFSVVDTDAGASYFVYVDGQEVATGTDADGGGVSSTFRMPKLGDTDKYVDVEVSVLHSDPGGTGGDFHGGPPWKGSPADVRYRAPVSRTARSEAPVGNRSEREQARARTAPRQGKARPDRSRGERKAHNARTDRARRKPASRGRGARREARPRRDHAPDSAAAGAGRPAPASSAAGVSSEPASSVASRAAPAGPGIKGAALVMLLLTVGSAGYGRWSARRKR